MTGTQVRRWCIVTRRNSADDTAVARTRANRGDLGAGTPPGRSAEGPHVEHAIFEAYSRSKVPLISRGVAWRDATIADLRAQLRE